MPIKLTFEAETSHDLVVLVKDYYLETGGFSDPFQSATFKLPAVGPDQEGLPAPDDIPLDATRGILPPAKSKKSRKPLPTPAEMLAATEPAPAMAPAAPAPTLAVDNGAMPSLDVLKSVITRAVRSAQKKEGPPDILNLLPAFKAKTGLEFVMHAKEEHRAALFDLVEAAKLEPV